MANFAKTIVPLLSNRFPNIQRALSRLCGDVADAADAASDAFVARMRRYSAHQQMATIKEVAKNSGLPLPVVARALEEQKCIDEIFALALEEVAQHGDAEAIVSDSSATATDDDWFDVYRREATDRSQGELKQAFVRILAGELQHPGTFSVRTLRVLGMLNRETATLFRRAVSVSIRLEISIPGGGPGHVRDVRIPALSGSLDDNCLIEHGLGYRELTELTASELLHSQYSSSATYGPISPSHPTMPNLQIAMIHQDQQWLLLPTSSSLNGVPLPVSGAMFTRAGKELLRIVDIEPMPSFTEQLQKHFTDAHYSMVPYKSP